MGAHRKQHLFFLASILIVSILAGIFLFSGRMSASAFAAEKHASDMTAPVNAHIDTVEVSSEGSAARIEGAPFALTDFSRVEKGSNRSIEGTYRGYSYLMDAPEDSLCIVDMTSFVVVYLPEALVESNGIDLASDQDRTNLQVLICALDAYDAQGNSVMKDTVTWYYTSQQLFTQGGIEFAFSQEYRAGYWYTSIRGEDGSDITTTANTGARISHVDYASLQHSDTVAIAAKPGAFDQLSSFFATLDWSPLWVTLKTTGTALVFIFILGLLAAWWAQRLSPRTQSVVDAILTIPMVLPPTVCGFLLLLCLGRNTPVGAWFDQIGFPLVFSWQATVIAAVVVAFPLMYRSARGAFEAIDADMLDAARTLGWSEGRIFFRLMLPLAWSSIAAGTMLAFARALGEFGATLFLAGNYVGITRTIPIAIYFEWMGGNIEAALFWTIVVIIVSFIVIFALNLWSKRTTKYRRKEVNA